MKAHVAMIALMLGFSTAAQAQEVTPVTIDNFAQAESDLYFGNAIRKAISSAPSCCRSCLRHLL
jgi:hypothetical protein